VAAIYLTEDNGDIPSARVFRITSSLRIVFAGFAALSLVLKIFGAEVQVFAAASLTDALQEIGLNYEKKSGDKLFFNFAASSILARQIQEGAPADIFISADEEKMNLLDKKGLVQEDSRKTLLSNSLVIVVPDKGTAQIQTAEDLKKARRLAIAEPNTVPAGIYARKYLEKIGLWSQIKDSIVPTENVRGALAAVESGNVDAAIVYKTDAAISKKVKIAYEVPEKGTPAIHYPMALLKRSKVRPAAENFLAELNSENARKTFEKFGFIFIR